MKMDQPKFRPEGEFGLRHKPVTISKIVYETPNTKTFFFKEKLEAKPGQFVMAWLPGNEEAPFCVANNTPFMLTIAAVGKLTEAIHSLKVGDNLWIRGPYGTHYTLEKTKRPLLVGGGYGAASLAFLGQELIKAHQKPVAILGARSKDFVTGVWRFEEIGIQTVVTTNDGSMGEEGFVTGPLEVLLKAKKADIIYACGPNPMLEALKILSKNYKVPVQLSFEKKMGCAMGLCGSCEHNGKLLCVEGPIIRF